MMKIEHMVGGHIVKSFTVTSGGDWARDVMRARYRNHRSVSRWVERIIRFFEDRGDFVEVGMDKDHYWITTNCGDNCYKVWFK